jgi:flagellar hook-associated protein 1 FlgK
VDVAFQNGNLTTPLQQSNLQGGNLGAYLAFRDHSLEPARNALGRVAMGLASSVNQQNQLGLDLNGVLGENLFKVAVPRVNSAADNVGTATISATISNVSALTTSDYQLSFDGANYSMLRLSDNTTTNLGATLPQTVDGFSVSLSAGTVAAGDSFLIRPVADAARDVALLTRDTAKIAAAAPMRASAALANLGTGTISNGSVNAPPPVDTNLQSPVSITFTSATTFTVAGAVPAVVGSVAYTSGQNISYNGWTVQISGTPATGDVFNIAANTNAAGDNRNALLMAGLQTKNLMANGTASLSGVYSQLVGGIGATTHEMDVTSQAQNNMLAQAVAAQQSVSGVNLDEEAANLLQYQRAYQASAKAMQIATRCLMHCWRPSKEETRCGQFKYDIRDNAAPTYNRLVCCIPSSSLQAGSAY